MVRSLRRSRRTFALALAFALMTLALGGVRPGRTDDTELLRFSTQNPYLMIMLDTSRSMNLAIAADTPLPGGGDDPDSRIYAAKEALFSVFRNVNDVNFGFASFNQDQIKVRGKHWLYYVKTLPGSYPNVGWPRPSPNDPMTVTDVDGDGILDIQHNPLFTDTGAANGKPSDLITFGTTFRDPSTNNPLTTAGTCAAPLDAGSAVGRARLNAFAKNGSDNLTTTLWVKAVTGNTTYRITFIRDGGPTTLGQQNLPITVAADQVSNCSAPPVVSSGVTVIFSKQDALNQHLVIDNGPAGEANGEDVTAHYWQWKDPVDGYTCTNARPFNGYGTEGNYDSGKKPSQNLPAINDPVFEAAVTNTDTFCIDPAVPASCIKIKPIKQTQYAPRGRPLDSGDFLPWDWLNDNKDEFLRRLAPNYTGAGVTPDFGVATYFDDFAADSSGVRPLKNPTQVPLIAEGDTAIARALIDLRCWYMGTAEEHGNSKCRESPFGNDFSGWRNVACNQSSGDPNFGCRRPFIIVISDGESDSNACQQNSPVAAVSDMDQHSAVKTWYVQVGPVKSNKGCQGSGLGNAISNAGGGECVVVANKQELLDTINKILGIIREATRAFASAAVPTVQASVQQSIYVSNFTPLRNNAIWDGHMNAFLKPLPLLNGKPDITKRCDALPADQRVGCFLWDAGKVLVDTQYPFNKSCSAIVSPATTAPCPAPGGNPTDWTGADKRRVYYSQLGTTGQWANKVRLFAETIKGTTSQAVERDLWAGLGLAFDPDPTSTNDPVRTLANATITRSLTLKQARVQGEATPRQFLLGDVFHSDPVVVGNPSDLRYFAQDLGHAASTTCSASPGSNTDKGYRCFFSRQQFRRKLLLVGHNDGMLHAYNAGTYDATAKEFTSGSGNEVFAYMPRTVMPTVNLTSQAGASTHRFSVDSSPVVTDVLIDPLFTGGTPVPANREWRTVVVGGLREGGRAYFAIDITEPEVLSKVGSEFLPQNSDDTDYVPECMGDGSLPGGCGRISYGAPLWEFTDNSSDQMPAPAATVPSRIPMDEDGNGFSDLGDTWSVPDVGRIRICTGGDCTQAANLQDHYVTIFGGGLDPSSKTAPRAGTYVYMVDIETGQTLYKRALPALNGNPAGAIPAAPSVVDLDNDGYLDRLYIVTTGGYLYRIDLGKDASGNFPELAEETVHPISGSDFDVLRVDPAFWQPRLIFDGTFDVDTGTRVVRPLYYRPSVFFVAKLGLAGIALGSGEREDLWSVDNQNGRFWVFVDDTDRTGAVLPYNEGTLLRLDVASTTTLGAQDLFVIRNRGEKGWFFVLGKNQRLITPGFALFGVMFFSSYEPLTFATTSATCDPLNPPPGGCPLLAQSCAPGAQDDTGYCAKTGTSRLFVVNVTNGDGLLPNATGDLNRFKAIGQFVTQPFTEPGQSHNTAASTGGATADDLSADDIRVMNIIKGLFPADCRFSNFRIDVKTIASDTSVQRIAAVPQCIIQKNWKEF